MESDISENSPRSSLKQLHGRWTVFSAAGSITSPNKASLSRWNPPSVPSSASMLSCDSRNGAGQDFGVDFAAPDVKFTKQTPTAKRAQSQTSALSAALRGCYLDQQGSSASDVVEVKKGQSRMEARKYLPGSCDTVPESEDDDREEAEGREAKPGSISLPLRARGEHSSPSSLSSRTSTVTDECPSLCDAESLDLVSQAEQRKVLLERLMEHIYATLAHNHAQGEGGGSTSFTPSSTTSGHSASAQPVRSTGKGGRGKRRPSQNDSDGSGDSDDDEEKHRRPVSKRSKHKQTGTMMLACPFFKRNPQRYQRERSCVGPGWETMHRLK